MRWLVRCARSVIAHNLCASKQVPIYQALELDNMYQYVFSGIETERPHCASHLGLSSTYSRFTSLHFLWGVVLSSFRSVQHTTDYPIGNQTRKVLIVLRMLSWHSQ